MRFFLALWVVMYHVSRLADNGAHVEWMPGAPPEALALLRTGYVAVTLFFILSGFVLAYNYPLDKKWSHYELSKFAIARFSRIYPAYFLGLLLVLPFIVYRVVKLFQPQLLGKEIFVAALNFLLLQAWIPQTALTWNYPGWSLSNEAFFYLCFPFIGVLLWRISRTTHILLTGILLWALSLAIPLWVILAPVPGLGDVPATALNIDPSVHVLASLIGYNPLLRILEFCLGILLGRLYFLLRTTHPRLSGRGYWFYLPGILGTGLLLSQADRLPLPLVNNGLLPLYACVILGLALEGGTVARILSAHPLVFLGNASYSMYILHAPVMTYMLILRKKLLPFWPLGLAWVMTYVLMMILLSSLVFKKVEEPLNRDLKRRLGKRLNRETGIKTEAIV
ncbi:MAG TPA: acyltransferase [Bryobacteraceae bacterium]|jgi:peptidoglycan/LPS O-acetylase OafA/YrhL|nr:acyltransferase [Bryobacteraceae bacterium]